MIIKSIEQLNTLSKKIGDQLEESDCIFLIGEIGVGKTTFARCLINYLQVKQSLKATDVLSPTFNLLYEYDLKKYKIMHYDLYRIKDEKELNNLGLFIEDQKTIKIIEWPNLIKASVFDKLEIHFDYVKNEHEREVRFAGTGKWKNFK